MAQTGRSETYNWPYWQAGDGFVPQENGDTVEAQDATVKTIAASASDAASAAESARADAADAKSLAESAANTANSASTVASNANDKADQAIASVGSVEGSVNSLTTRVGTVESAVSSITSSWIYGSFVNPDASRFQNYNMSYAYNKVTNLLSVYGTAVSSSDIPTGTILLANFGSAALPRATSSAGANSIYAAGFTVNSSGVKANISCAVTSDGLLNFLSDSVCRSVYVTFTIVPVDPSRWVIPA